MQLMNHRDTSVAADAGRLCRSVARIQQTLVEIEWLKYKGYTAQLPPRLIIDIGANKDSFYSLEDLVTLPP
jgi:hypothetical protein